MPRKTIASLEATIAEQSELIDQQKGYIDRLQTALEKQANDPNVYLSYVPSGNKELDAMLVAYRAIRSLGDYEGQKRAVTWVSHRITDELEVV